MVTGTAPFAALLAASLAGTYDCAIDHQAIVTESGVAGGNHSVQFPGTDQNAWRFRVRVPEGAAPEVTVEWAANPIQIAGTHASLAVAPEQIAFIAMAGGGCMFTEQACLSLVELSAREDGSAAFLILPAGSTRDTQTGIRSLFHVVFVGTCRRPGGEGQ